MRTYLIIYAFETDNETGYGDKKVKFKSKPSAKQLRKVCDKILNKYSYRNISILNAIECKNDD